MAHAGTEHCRHSSVFNLCGGATGPNQTKLTLLAGFILALNARDIWVVAGDMNMTPQQLAASGWLDEVDGVIVVPHNSDHTCTVGSDPRMIDYAIIAKGTEVFFPDLRAIDDGIWTSHYGLELTINADPLVSVRWSLQLPAPFPHPPLEKRAPDPNSKSSRRKAEALGKRSAQAQAACATRLLRLQESRHLKSLAIDAARAGKPPPSGLTFSDAASADILDAFEPEAEFQMDIEADEEPHPDDEGPPDLDCASANGMDETVFDASTSAQPEEEPALDLPPRLSAVPGGSSSNVAMSKECLNLLWSHATLPRTTCFSPPSYIVSSTPFQQTRVDALRLGRDFGLWASRMESYFCELYEIHPLSRRKFQGRARVQELKLGSPPAPPADAITEGASCTWWAAVASKLDLLGRMKGGGAAGVVKIRTLEDKICLTSACVPSNCAPKLSSVHRAQWKEALANVASQPLPKLLELAAAAKLNKTLAAREAVRTSLAACGAWFDRAAAKGYGAVHKAAKPKVFVPSELIFCRSSEVSVTKDQVEYLQEKRQPWAEKWNHDGEHDPQLLRLLSEFRKEAVEVSRDPLKVADLDSALSAEAENKSRGLVQVTPADLTRLPLSGKQQLFECIKRRRASRCLALAVSRCCGSAYP